MGFGRPILGFGRPILGFGRPIFGFGRPILGFGRPILGFGRPIFGFGRPIFGFGRPLLVADRGERGSGRHLHPPSGGRGDQGCSEDSWMDRSPSVGVRAAGQVGAVGSLPLSRCATAPPRGERLDRAVRDGTAGWQTWAPGPACCVRRSLPRSLPAPLCLRHLPPPSGGRGEMEITRRSPRGERLDRAVREGGLQAGRLGLLDQRAAFGGRCLDR